MRRYVKGQLTESFEAPDPLSAVDQILAAYHSAPMTHIRMFHGGWVGCFGYDMVRYVEPRLADSCPRDELGVPDIWLMLSEEIVVFHNLAGALTLVVNANAQNDSTYALAVSRLDALEVALSQPNSPLEPTSLPTRDATAV